MSDLAALAERVERADASEQRVMLTLAFDACFPEPTPDCEPAWRPENPKQPIYHAWKTRQAVFIRFVGAEAWLDAAMTLVPEGWFWETGNQTCSILGEAMLHKPEFVSGQTKLKFERGRGKTPALALVAAALRAKRSHNHDD